MNQITYVFLLVCFFIGFPNLGSAVNSVPKKAPKEKVQEKKKIKSKVGFFKKIKSTYIAKRFKKIFDDEKVKKRARNGLKFGIISVGLLLLSPLVAIIGGYVAPIIFGFLTVLTAILGSIFSISALNNIKKSIPGEYKKEKNKALIGLILSMLIFVLPIIIAIVTFLIYN